MTVELGRRYFPHCSEVLDKFMDDDLPDLFYLEGGTQAEKEMKEMRFVELKKDVRKAFNKDKAEQSRLSSSSSSSSKKDGVNCKLRKLWWPVKYILNNCAYCMHIFERNFWEPASVGSFSVQFHPGENSFVYNPGCDFKPGESTYTFDSL